MSWPCNCPSQGARTIFKKWSAPVLLLLPQSFVAELWTASIWKCCADWWHVKPCQTQVFRNICLFWHQPACPSSSFHDSAEQTERTQLKLAETTARKVEIRTRTKAEPMSGTSNGMDKYWEHMWWGTHLKLGVRISEDWSILFHFLGYARVCWGILTRLCLVLWWTTFNIFQPPENWRPLQCFMDKAGLCARRSSGLLASCICISWDFAGNMFI